MQLLKAKKLLIAKVRLMLNSSQRHCDAKFKYTTTGGVSSQAVGHGHPSPPRYCAEAGHPVYRVGCCPSAKDAYSRNEFNKSLSGLFVQPILTPEPHREKTRANPSRQHQQKGPEPHRDSRPNEAHIGKHGTGPSQHIDQQKNPVHVTPKEYAAADSPLKVKGSYRTMKGSGNFCFEVYFPCPVQPVNTETCKETSSLVFIAQFILHLPIFCVQAQTGVVLVREYSTKKR